MAVPGASNALPPVAAGGTLPTPPGTGVARGGGPFSGPVRAWVMGVLPGGCSRADRPAVKAAAANLCKADRCNSIAHMTELPAALTQHGVFKQLVFTNMQHDT
jgi:hypothetical protein